MTSYIIFAFVSGFLLATVIFWIANRKQQQDWQAEYRRLMGGCWAIYCRLVGCQGVGAIKDDYKARFRLIVEDMQKLHKGDR